MGVRNSHSKRAISIRATEVPLYCNWMEGQNYCLIIRKCSMTDDFSDDFMTSICLNNDANFGI